jgi:putative transposase
MHRWGITYSPQLEDACHWRKRPVWVRWRLDETDIKGQGQWRALARAVATPGQTLDFLRTAQRDQAAARRFLQQASRRHGLPETITMDGSDANAAAINSSHEAHGTVISIRQGQYWQNIVAQAHSAGKRVTRPMWGAKRSKQPKTRWPGSS